MLSKISGQACLLRSIIIRRLSFDARTHVATRPDCPRLPNLGVGASETTEPVFLSLYEYLYIHGGPQKCSPVYEGRGANPL